MNVLIIEDEHLSAELLSTLLHKLDPSITIVAIADSVRSSVALFQQGVKADLIFLDIHLADGLSFDLFTQVQIDTPVIFTTAFSEYAIKAFEINSVDYLLKPIGLTELQRAIEKFKRFKRSDQQMLLDNITEAYRQMNRQYKQRFMVKSGTALDSIKVEDICFFITQDGVTFIVIANGKRFAVDYTLDQLEQMVSPGTFFRINRKVIVSIGAIGKVSTYFNGRLMLEVGKLDGESAVVSRERVNDFKLWLDQ